MEIKIPIPDDLAERLGPHVERRMIEAFLVQEYRIGRMTKPELRRLLGNPSLYELDGILKAHGVYLEYTIDDFRREMEALKRLGF